MCVCVCVCARAWVHQNVSSSQHSHTSARQFIPATGCPSRQIKYLPLCCPLDLWVRSSLVCCVGPAHSLPLVFSATPTPRQHLEGSSDLLCWLTHSHPLTRSLPLTHSRTHSLAPALTHSLTHSLAHALALAHSLGMLALNPAQHSLNAQELNGETVFSSCFIGVYVQVGSSELTNLRNGCFY